MNTSFRISKMSDAAEQSPAQISRETTPPNWRAYVLWTLFVLGHLLTVPLVQDLLFRLGPLIKTQTDWRVFIVFPFYAYWSLPLWIAWTLPRYVPRMRRLWAWAIVLIPNAFLLAVAIAATDTWEVIVMITGEVFGYLGRVISLYFLSLLD